MLLTEFHGSETVNLTAPAGDVFDVLVDVDRMTEWNEHLHHVIDASSDPLTEGVEWVLEMRAMGTDWPSRARALRVDPDALVFEHRSATDDGNPSYALWSWQVSPRGDESTLTVTWTVHPKTFWRRLLLARVRRGFLASEVRASVAGLDSYLATTPAHS
jgi:uncharacterized protein YndB with AHSA1/START domain